MDNCKKSQEPTNLELVSKARGSDPVARGVALDELLSLYYPALEAHLHFRFPGFEHEIKDWLQDFVAKKILKQELLKHFDKKRGKFRHFLKKCLDNFVLEKFKKPFVPTVEIPPDLPAPEPAPDSTEKIWVQAVVHLTLKAMKTECDIRGRALMWEVFNARIAIPILDDTDPLAYEDLCKTFKLKSPNQAYTLLNDGKEMFMKFLYAVIGQYSDDKTVCDERDDLINLLNRMNRKPGKRTEVAAPRKK